MLMVHKVIVQCSYYVCHGLCFLSTLQLLAIAEVCGKYVPHTWSMKQHILYLLKLSMQPVSLCYLTNLISVMCIQNNQQLISYISTSQWNLKLKPVGQLAKPSPETIHGLDMPNNQTFRLTKLPYEAIRGLRHTKERKHQAKMVN